MTPEEAQAAFEKQFATVTSEVGYREAGEPVDVDCAPDGSRYVVLSSGGVQAAGMPCGAWFTDPDRAVEAWLKEAWAYADARGGDALSWRDPPTLVEMEMMPIDQAATLHDLRKAGATMVRLCYVWARLAISKGNGDE